jgi:hypothetical protein
MTASELPFGQVQITEPGPGRAGAVLVIVDGKAVTHLPVTEIGFSKAYSDGIGRVTLTLIAGDCHLSSRDPYPDVP